MKHPMKSLVIVTLWLFNIAMENGPFIVDLPIEMVIFHSYGTVYQRVTTLLGNWVAPADRSMIATEGRSIGDCGDCASLFTLLSTFVLRASLAGWWYTYPSEKY